MRQYQFLFIFSYKSIQTYVGAGPFTFSCVTVTYHLDVGLPIQMCTYTTLKSDAWNVKQGQTNSSS